MQVDPRAHADAFIIEVSPFASAFCDWCYRSFLNGNNNQCLHSLISSLVDFYIICWNRGFTRPNGSLVEACPIVPLGRCFFNRSWFESILIAIRWFSTEEKQFAKSIIENCLRGEIHLGGEGYGALLTTYTDIYLSCSFNSVVSHLYCISFLHVYKMKNMFFESVLSCLKWTSVYARTYANSV